LSMEKRRGERVDADFDCSIRLYLKNGSEKHQVRLINCSEGGLCVDVPQTHDPFARESLVNFLFHVGDDVCAFAAIVKWVSGKGALEGTNGGRRYGAKIAEGSSSNPELYADYVRYLFLKRRFQ